MRKNMYSLILSEDVVREIDRLAYENGVNRSNFIDEILAEYCRMVTPEMRIKTIFDRVLELCEGSRFLPLREANSGIMTLKTCLEYKYHPTVKYEVQLFRRRGHAFGLLRIGLRSQNADVLRYLTDFFTMLAHAEQKYSVGKRAGGSFALESGKFVRTLVLPEDREYTAEELAVAISDYVGMIDEMLNDYFLAKYRTSLELEFDYGIKSQRLSIKL